MEDMKLENSPDLTPGERVVVPPSRLSRPRIWLSLPGTGFDRAELDGEEGNVGPKMAVADMVHQLPDTGTSVTWPRTPVGTSSIPLRGFRPAHGHGLWGPD
jgi:hypothetical protein